MEKGRGRLLGLLVFLGSSASSGSFVPSFPFGIFFVSLSSLVFGLLVLFRPFKDFGLFVFFGMRMFFGFLFYFLVFVLFGLFSIIVWSVLFKIGKFGEFKIIFFNVRVSSHSLTPPPFLFQLFLFLIWFAWISLFIMKILILI